MNKQEKIISALLGLALVGWMLYSSSEATKQAKIAAERRAAAAAEAAPPVALPSDTAISAAPSTIQNGGSASSQTAAHEDVRPPAPTKPEEVVELANDDVVVTVSSHGGTLKQVVLNKYNKLPGKASADNPPVVLDFSEMPGLALSGIAGLEPNASYQLTPDGGGRAVTLSATTDQNLLVTRRIEILDDYQIKVSDSIKNLSSDIMHLGTNFVSVGVMGKGASKNEILSADSLPDAEKLKTIHWGSQKATKALLVGDAVGGGCGGPPSALLMPEHTEVPIPGNQKWVAIKSRFFVTALSCTTERNIGFDLITHRKPDSMTYELASVGARMQFQGGMLAQGEELKREYTLYVGPKKLSLLKKMGNQMDAIMDFGIFKWLCELLVPTMNFFYKLIPSWGIAIILLTFLVRIIFWPLTQKSTQSMKRMQELQPKLKEIQAKYKDNPTKMQQETWACYRDNKVNPLASCLPMLIQIPVFIALFWVLRSAVELRYAPFLWIADLSEPENLFAGMIPFVGSLNILPILMAATMALQTYLTPTAGDPRQQQMMMIMMPIMMLVMLYGFPSALSLYWTVSQVLSIIQMWMMRRKSAQTTLAASNASPYETTPLTRQQRRAADRG